MVRRRAPGGGRKPRGEGAAIHFNSRIAPEVRRRLEIDAARNGRSLSHEIEVRLADSVRVAPQPDEPTRAFAYLIGELATILRVAERLPQEAAFDWTRSRFDFEAFRYAVLHLLERLAPVGEAEHGRYPLFESPEQAGRVALHTVLALLEREETDSWARGREREASSGSLYYAMPQAAKALGQHRSKGSG
jgi:hypothetical protein